MKKNIVGLKWY